MLYIMCSGRFTKVGICKSEKGLKRRVENLQTGNPVKLEVYAMFPLFGVELEKDILTHFNYLKCPGGKEWLNCDPETILTWIALYIDKGYREQ